MRILSMLRVVPDGDGVSRARSAARAFRRSPSIPVVVGCWPPNTRLAVRFISSSVVTALWRSSSVARRSIGQDANDYLLREHFSSVGEVASVELLMRGYNGTVPTGSAIVQFYSASAASSAIADLNGTELDGRRLYVRAYFT